MMSGHQPNQPRLHLDPFHSGRILLISLAQNLDILSGLCHDHSAEKLWSFPECTLPETNMAPENRYLEKEIPIGNHHLKVPC